MNMKKTLSVFLIISVFLTSMLCGCGKAPVSLDGITLSPIGEGEKSFNLTVTDSEGETVGYAISTNAETVGDALFELELIDGEPGPYGLYVKTVLGKTLDFNTHGKYWAFYIDGVYATSGIDKTEIENGVHYALKAE